MKLDEFRVDEIMHTSRKLEDIQDSEPRLNESGKEQEVSKQNDLESQIDEESKQNREISELHESEQSLDFLEMFFNIGFDIQIAQYNSNSLAQLPDLDCFLKLYGRSVTDPGNNAYKRWYKQIISIYVNVEPVFKKNRPLKVSIFQELDENDFVTLPKTYIGERNEQGLPHGVGIKIKPLWSIEEACYKDGKPHGQCKTILFTY